MTPERGESAESERVGESWWPLVRLLVLVVVLQLLAGTAIYCAWDDWGPRASFGDMFGAVGTLFSGLAFAAFIYALHLQRRELQLQRNELALTRQELRRAAEAQESASRYVAQQLRLMQAQESREDSAAREEAMPRFKRDAAMKLKDKKAGLIVYACPLVNLGGPVSRLHVQSSEARVKVEAEPADFVPTNARFELVVAAPCESDEVNVRLESVDRLNRRILQRFVVRPREGTWDAIGEPIELAGRDS